MALDTQTPLSSAAFSSSPSRPVLWTWPLGALPYSEHVSRSFQNGRQPHHPSLAPTATADKTPAPRSWKLLPGADHVSSCDSRWEGGVVEDRKTRVISLGSSYLDAIVTFKMTRPTASAVSERILRMSKGGGCLFANWIGQTWP